MEKPPTSPAIQVEAAESHELSAVPVSERPMTNDSVTPKTWLVVFALSASSGLSIWLLPTVGTVSAQVSAKLHADAGQSTWFLSAFSVAAIVASMICGANSDLFGRRYFILFGNLCMVISGVLTGAAKTSNHFIAGMTIGGFGTGCCQMACFALPELLPLKWRPLGVVLSEAFAYFCLVVGPVAGKFAVNNGGENGEGWRWLFYPNAIANAVTGLMLAFLYFPPAHPRGIPWHQALRQLDYVGIALFILSITLIMVGIVDTSYIADKSDPKIVGTLVSGFVLLVIFGCWETWAPLKQPLTPSRIFSRNRGRAFTAPFICGISSGMFYLGPNILWGTMVSVFFTKPTDPISHGMKLAMVQGLGITVGSMGLAILGGRIKHWKWQMVIAFTLMTLFGGLFALGRPGRVAPLIFICACSGITYSWAAYLGIAYIQFGAEQVDLGIAGGLAAVTRYAGALIATTVFSTILNNTLTSEAVKRVIPAAEAAGASQAVAQQVLSALPLGADALAKIQGATTAIIAAAGSAFTESYVKATQTVALTSIAFGGVGVISALFLEDITAKMTPKIEVFLENDVNAEKNKFH
ncbi:hypothetical protein AYO21_07942 [Fonsecaea monophora]|uniref:Major facilitator superfamily (MFS) profile domain-containing protein n=1 Tax=Fonsecaea monophora TaxID=254056 RepID=A0A177F1Z1_9EURO|nr:hypothetical protein AYO21_07942 [Fonsecaea monophora]OAG37836.1 hypothetical protein AYO21_07942 [Fonsecaea monophora]